MPNIWGNLGGVNYALPMATLLGLPDQLLGMDSTGVFLEYKSARFKAASGQFYVPVGAVGLPSYSFVTDLLTGWWLIGAGNPAMSINGAIAIDYSVLRTLFYNNVRMSSGFLIQEKFGANIAAAANIEVDTVTKGNYFKVVAGGGAILLAQLGGATLPAGTCIEVEFSIPVGSITLVYDANFQDLPGAVNLPLQDRDIARYRKTNDASPYWKMVSFSRGASSAILSAKGDLLVGLGAGATSRLPAGVDGYALQSSSGNTEGLIWLPPAFGVSILNGYLQWTVAANVLTVAIKTYTGADPSATAPVFMMKQVGAVPLIKKCIVPTSAVLNVGSTMGVANNVPFRLWAAVLWDDTNSIFRIALFNAVATVAGGGSGRDVTNIYSVSSNGAVTPTNEGGGLAINSGVFYANGAGIPPCSYSLLGWASWNVGLPVAGTWSLAPNGVHLFTAATRNHTPGQVIQIVRVDSSAMATGATQIPYDDTIPQNVEGDQYLSATITPNSVTANAANVLRITAQLQLATDAAGNNHMAAALFQDAVANAIKVASMGTIQNMDAPLTLNALILSGLVAASTFKIRAGIGAAGTTTLNGSAAARKYGGTYNSFIQIEEISA